MFHAVFPYYLFIVVICEINQFLFALQCFMVIYCLFAGKEEERKGKWPTTHTVGVQLDTYVHDMCSVCMCVGLCVGDKDHYISTWQGRRNRWGWWGFGPTTFGVTIEKSYNLIHLILSIIQN